MNRSPWPLVLLFLFSSAGACRGNPVNWPRWAHEIAEQLRCGMTLEQIKGLAHNDVTTLEAGAHPWLGRYYIRKGNSDLWLRFDDHGGLESIVLSTMDGWRIMATKNTPRKNLCSGELTFLMRILTTNELEGAEFYLDGHKVDVESGMLEVSVGEHEFRIQKTGYEPIIKRLHFGANDRGDYRLDLTKDRLRPAR